MFTGIILYGNIMDLSIPQCIEKVSIQLHGDNIKNEISYERPINHSIYSKNMNFVHVRVLFDII